MKMKKPESRAENKEENSWQRCLKKIGSGREREAKSVTLFVWSKGEGGEGEQVRERRESIPVRFFFIFKQRKCSALNRPRICVCKCTHVCAYMHVCSTVFASVCVCLAERGANNSKIFKCANRRKRRTGIEIANPKRAANWGYSEHGYPTPRK